MTISVLADGIHAYMLFVAVSNGLSTFDDLFGLNGTRAAIAYNEDLLKQTCRVHRTWNDEFIMCWAVHEANLWFCTFGSRIQFMVAMQMCVHSNVSINAIHLANGRERERECLSLWPTHTCHYTGKIETRATRSISRFHHREPNELRLLNDLHAIRPAHLSLAATTEQILAILFLRHKWFAVRASQFMFQWKMNNAIAFRTSTEWTNNLYEICVLS